MIRNIVPKHEMLDGIEDGENRVEDGERVEFSETRVFTERDGRQDPVIFQTQGADHGQLADAPHCQAEVVGVVDVVGVLAKVARVEMLVSRVSTEAACSSGQSGTQIR